jgi:hypothetical protein
MSNHITYLAAPTVLASTAAKAPSWVMLHIATISKAMLL